MSRESLVEKLRRNEPVRATKRRTACRWLWQQRRRSCRGFTLVELLTVIAILGVLMSLLLAAVQASREVARRAQCANQIKNQMLALQNFHSAMQRFPAGKQITSVGEYSWCLETLPYLEQP